MNRHLEATARELCDQELVNLSTVTGDMFSPSNVYLLGILLRGVSVVDRTLSAGVALKRSTIRVATQTNGCIPCQ